MNIVRMVASTLALLSTLALAPAVAQADDRPRPPAPVTLDQDRDRRDDGRRGDDRDARWGFDRDGRWGRFAREQRRDFDRDWRGYRSGWARVVVRDDRLCRFEWENGASPERMFVLGCFER